MLNSIEIRNYRNLEHLKIEKLGRINLIVGKNNTGKTSLLEALSIWGLNQIIRNNYIFMQQWLYFLAMQRDENYILRLQNSSVTEQIIEKNLKTISSLIFKRQQIYNAEYNVKIGNLGLENFFQFGLVKQYTKNVKRDQPNGEVIITSVIVNAESESEIPIDSIANPVLNIIFNEKSEQGNTKHLSSLPLGNNNQALAYQMQNSLPSLPLQFVWTKNSAYIGNNNFNASLWDRISFDPSKMEYVVETLKIIQPDIEILAFPSNEFSQRNPAVKLVGMPEPFPATSMGDGINRILTIILSMVNCENGYLLIDEFENGLHYSVQEKLWEIIFHLAERLNVQVFATTHSYDCIDAFSEVLNGGKYSKDSGVMIRLDNYENNIEATVYDANEIQNTTRLHVDPR